MKAKLEFSLPEEECEFKLAQRGAEYFSVILECRNLVREHEKYGMKLEDCLEKIKEELYSANTEDIA